MATLPTGLNPLGGQIAGTIAARLAGLGFSFVAGVAAARALAPAGRGQLAVLVAVPALFAMLASLGLDAANIRFAGSSSHAHSQVVRWSICWSLIAGVLGPGAWAAVAAGLPLSRLGLSLPHFTAMLALCPVILATALLTAAEIGRGRAVPCLWASASSLALYALLICFLWLTGQARPLLAFGCFAASQFVMLTYLLWRGLSGGSQPGGVDPSSYLRYSVRAYPANVAQLAGLRVQVLLTQVLGGSAVVGLYVTAVAPVEALLLLPVAVGLVLTPRVAAGRLSYHEVSSVARRTAAAAAGAAALLAVVAPLVVPAVYGAEFGAAVPVIWALLPGVVVFSSARTLQSYLAARDRLGPVLSGSVGGLAISVAALFVLVPPLGAIGAGVAASLGQLVFGGWVIAAFVRMRQRDSDILPAAASHLRPIAGGAAQWNMQ